MGVVPTAVKELRARKGILNFVRPKQTIPLNLWFYFAFADAFFFLSAHRFFIRSDNLLRPAAVRWRPGFAVARFAGATLTLPLT